MLQRLQENFCVEFVRCGNATQAYKNAGYKVRSDKVAGVAAARLLGNVRVQKRIEELRLELDSHKIMDAVRGANCSRNSLAMRRRERQTVCGQWICSTRWTVFTSTRRR